MKLTIVSTEHPPSQLQTQSQNRIRILGICGSARGESYNHHALLAAQELLPDGSTMEIATLAALPLFNQDDESSLPDAVIELKGQIRRADAILIATPEHNYSIPALLKNALDWGSRPRGQNDWTGKPAAIFGASPGGLGTARAQYHLRQICVCLNLIPINQPEVMITDAMQRFDKGILIHQPTRDILRALVNSLVIWTRRLQYSQQGESLSRPTETG